MFFRRTRSIWFGVPVVVVVIIVVSPLFLFPSALAFAFQISRVTRYPVNEVQSALPYRILVSMPVDPHSASRHVTQDKSPPMHPHGASRHIIQKSGPR